MNHPAVPEPLPTGTPTSELAAGTSLWLDAWKRLRKNKLAVVSGIVMMTIVVACVFGPTVTRLVWVPRFSRASRIELRVTRSA